MKQQVLNLLDQIENEIVHLSLWNKKITKQMKDCIGFLYDCKFNIVSTTTVISNLDIVYCWIEEWYMKKYTNMSLEFLHNNELKTLRNLIMEVKNVLNVEDQLFKYEKVV